MARTKTIEIPLALADKRSTPDRLYVRGYVDRDAASGDPGDPIRFVAANEGMMADRLDLQMDGADLERFKRNPVILWAHDYRSVPIARATDVFTKGTQLIEDVVFDQEDDFAVQVEKKYRDGWLNAVSIGFDPKVIVDETGKAVSWWEGGKVSEWELLETSCVPVPMDADALVDGRSRAGLIDDLRDLFGKLSIPDPVRVGAVLSARNKEKLEEAQTLIAEVLATAAKEEEESESESEESDDEDRSANLYAGILAGLNQVTA